VHALTRALPWAGVWPSRLFGRPCLNAEATCLNVCVCGPTLVPTFRLSDARTVRTIILISAL